MFLCCRAPLILIVEILPVDDTSLPLPKCLILRNMKNELTFQNSSVLQVQCSFEYSIYIVL